MGTLAAASPALGVKQGLLFVPVLSAHGHSPASGRFVALSMKTGRIVWSQSSSRPAPSPRRSSSATPCTSETRAGHVYSLERDDGHTNWTYHASGAVKGGPALISNGVAVLRRLRRPRLCPERANGHEVWAGNTDGAHFGFGSGNFYSTPAVAFGRVYMGNTDGRVYSFAASAPASSRWATGTGAYVYASAGGGQDTPGLGPTVYVGSYDGNFYAFNAHPAPFGGAIRRAARSRARRRSWATSSTTRTSGRRPPPGSTCAPAEGVLVPRRGFNPVVADNGAIYLSGYTMLYQMLPEHH